MTSSEPKTLMEAIRYFSDPDTCLNFVASFRWPDGVACPTCGSLEVKFMPTRRVWACKTRHPRWQFSVKVGTIFEDSAIPLDKWLTAMWMIANAKNGVSSYEIARSIGVSQKSAWHMMHRIRLAMEDGTFNKLNGEVEADETYIGGKARNMHFWRRQQVIKGRTGGASKTPVFGALQRNGPDGHSVMRTRQIDTNRRREVQAAVREYVEEGSILYTDGLQSYRSLASEFKHAVVEHDAHEYVKGDAHVNGVENFWSLLKRSLNGTYVSVEPFHLFRYLDEQVFRFNSRYLSDAERFLVLARATVGKRLTWQQLTTSEGQTPA